MGQGINLREKYRRDELKSIKVIGLDNGDGAICYATMGVVNGRLQPVPRSIDRYGEMQLQKPNIIACYEKEDNEDCAWLNNPEPRTDYKDGARCYCNIKCAPDSDKYSENHEFLDGKGTAIGKSRYTNRELMERAFQVIVSTIIDREFDDEDNCKLEKIMLVVGCPSGGDWKAGKYADVLENALIAGLKKAKEGKNGNLGGLKSYCDEYEKQHGAEEFPIHVVVVPESNAAVAFETGDNMKDYKGKIILLVDMGSSTTDFTLVVDGKIVDTYTRNLGGEQFERLMFEPMMELFNKDEKYSNAKFLDPTYVKYGLRVAKEEYFGNSGNKCKGAFFTALLDNDEMCNITIDKNFMNKVMYKNKGVMIPGSMTMGIDNLENLSIMEAYDTVFKEAKERFENCLKDKYGLEYKLDQVIATGGVSIIKELQALLCKVFEVASIASDRTEGTEVLASAKNPHTSVACGLAKVGDTELKKLEAIYNFEDKLNEVFDGDQITGTVIDGVANYFAEKEADAVNKSLEKWVDDTAPQSLLDWWISYIAIKINREGAMKSAIDDAWEKRDMDVKLNEAVNDYFKSIFETELSLEFNVSGADFVESFNDVPFNKPVLPIRTYFYHVWTLPSYTTALRSEANIFRKTKSACLKDFTDNRYNQVEPDIAQAYRANLRKKKVWIRDNLIITNTSVAGAEYKALTEYISESLKKIVLKQVEDYVDDLTMYFYMNKDKVK